MNGAMIDSTFLVFFKLKIAKTYDAMLSTPLGVGDVALGELSWCVLRGALYSAAFLCHHGDPRLRRLARGRCCAGRPPC